MNRLSHSCFNHPERPAAARCPLCGVAFCRECVSEHNGRFLCASCLQQPRTGQQTTPLPLTQIVQGMLSLVVLTLTLYLFFHLAIP